MPKYTVESPLAHDGKSYAVGDTVEMSKAQADALPEGVLGAATKKLAEVPPPPPPPAGDGSNTGAGA